MANALEHAAAQTKLEWTASLNTEFQPAKNYRRTSIICTIGMLAMISIRLLVTGVEKYTGIC